MDIDCRQPWHLFLAETDSPSVFLPAGELSALLARPEGCESPGRFAAVELAEALGGLLPGLLPGTGAEEDGTGIIILNAGASKEGEPRRGFAWRAAARRVEIHGDSGEGLLAGVYDFLQAAGFRWLSPDSGTTRPAEGAALRLERSSGLRREPLPRPVLILGHGSYLGAAEDYMLWAARNGYAGLFAHTTGEALALGAAPYKLYERKQSSISGLARRLGLELELGGHGLSALLPASLFKTEPDCFRMKGGRRRRDGNFCSSSPRALEIAGAGLSALAARHPETRVFHLWPDDLPGGGWCECPLCSGLSPAAQALRINRALASVLERERPEARLSFLAYHDTEELAAGLETAERLPANLELLWAPRKRSWARPYDAEDSGLNQASRGAFEKARKAWLAAGGGPVAVFEYWEDAVLFKTARPPLSRVMAGDLAYYAGAGLANKIGILLTGDRLPLAPSPNPWLLPRLLALGQEGAGPAAAPALMADWCRAAYGPAAPAMADYWAALEAAWALDLDIEPGDCELFLPEPLSSAVDRPPADWGDPWKANLERLAARRARCEELFDLLRRAEAALARAGALLAGEASGADEAARDHFEAEGHEYAPSSALLELDCARLSAYHELAAGSTKAAADLAVIALSILDGLYRLQRKMGGERREAKNGHFLLFIHYELRLRSMARAGSRRLIPQAGRIVTYLELGLRAAALLHVWERGEKRRPSRRSREKRRILVL